MLEPHSLLPVSLKSDPTTMHMLFAVTDLTAAFILLDATVPKRMALGLRVSMGWCETAPLTTAVYTASVATRVVAKMKI